MKLSQFLNYPTKKFKNKVINILIGYFILFIWIYLADKLINFLDPPPTALFDSSSPDDTTPSKIALLSEFFFAVILAPLWEELAFRHAPALIAKALGEKLLMPIIIISSIIFGWEHGHGPESLLLQGVMGFIFFSVYVKNNYSYWSSVTLHSLWNGVIFFGTYHKYIW